MCGKVNKMVLVILVLFPALFVSAQNALSDADPRSSDLLVACDQLNDLQRLLDEHSASGNQIADISYHSKLKDLNTKGTIEIAFRAADPKTKHVYRALVTEFRASSLQDELNAAGKAGYRLVGQSPIVVESGFLRTRDNFIAIMEKTAESLT